MIPAGEGALKEITKSKAGGLMNDELQIYAEKYFSEVLVSLRLQVIFDRANLTDLATPDWRQHYTQ